MVFYRICFTQGEMAGKAVPVSRDIIMIGRSRSCDVRVRAPDVSGKHVVIRVLPEGVFMTNLSAHFTRAGTTRVGQNYQLKLPPNTDVCLGSNTVFHLREVADEAQTNAGKTGVIDESDGLTAFVPGEDGKTNSMTAATVFGTFRNSQGGKSTVASSGKRKTVVTLTDRPLFPNGYPSGKEAGDANVPDATNGGVVTGVADVTGMPGETSAVTAKTVFVSPEQILADDPETVLPDEIPSEIVSPKVSPVQTDESLTAAGPDRTVSEPADDSAFLSDETVADGNGNREGDEEGGTEIFNTVLVSPEEIQNIKDTLARKARRKLFVRVGVAAVVFAVAAIAYFSLGEKQEKKLSWPTNASGKMDDAVRYFVTPLGSNTMWLVYPKDSSVRVHVDQAGRTVIRSRLGKLRDVPFVITFDCHRDTNCLYASRAERFAVKRQGLEDAGGWNFQAVSPPAFRGANNGFPYMEIQYLRHDTNTMDATEWFGYLLFAVCADCEITMTREIPATELWRGASLLAREKLLYVSDSLIDGYWEGSSDYRKETVAKLLAEADGNLAVKNPHLWKDVEYQLQSALIQSGASGEEYQKALSRLKELRKLQKIEYDRLQAVWQRAKALGNKEGARQCKETIDTALEIFASRNDRRNFLLQKGVWK